MHIRVFGESYHLMLAHILITFDPRDACLVYAPEVSIHRRGLSSTINRWDFEESDCDRPEIDKFNKTLAPRWAILPLTVDVKLFVILVALSLTQVGHRLR